MKVSDNWLWEQVNKVELTRWDLAKELKWSYIVTKQLGIFNEGTWPIEWFVKRWKTKEKAMAIIFHTILFDSSQICCRVNSKKGTVTFWCEENGGGYLYLE